MLRVSKVSEYGVLALGFIGTKTTAQSAREIAEGLHIPYEITAKTLQKLKETGFVLSTKGINGGYTLASSLADIKLGEVIDALEGPLAIVECITAHEPESDVNGSAAKDKSCQRSGTCEVKFGMNRINQRIRNLLQTVSLEELVKDDSVKAINKNLEVKIGIQPS